MRAKLSIAAVLFASIMTSTVFAHAAEPGYFNKLGHVFMRGVKNVVSSPYEIPYTIGKYDSSGTDNPRAFRDLAGLGDGIFRTLTRFGSGAWDMIFAFVPTQQNETTPLSPETFF